MLRAAGGIVTVSERFTAKVSVLADPDASGGNRGGHAVAA